MKIKAAEFLLGSDDQYLYGNLKTIETSILHRNYFKHLRLNACGTWAGFVVRG